MSEAFERIWEDFEMEGEDVTRFYRYTKNSGRKNRHVTPVVEASRDT